MSVLWFFLVFAFFQNNCFPSRAISGVIWNKNEKKFNPIFNYSHYYEWHMKRLAKSRLEETHNFEGELITGGYFDEKNMVVFYDNNTRAAGVLVDIWNVLADYLNFTFQIIRYENKVFGANYPNGTYTGLLRALHEDEIQIIMRTGYYSFRRDVMDFTTPLWPTSYRLYIRPEWKYDNSWLLTLFAKETWCSIIILVITLSLTGFFLQKQDKLIKDGNGQKQNFNLNDHFFHTFAIMCSQGYIPENFYSKFKILSLSKSIFAWLVLIAFNSHLIHRMANRISSPPFTNMDTLINETQYIVLSFKGSMIYQSFQDRWDKMSTGNMNYLHRVEFILNQEELYEKCCFGDKQYAIFEIEDRRMAKGKLGCRLMVVGGQNYSTWITSGIKKNMPYKRSFDIGILKMHEVGLIDVLKERWLQPRLGDFEGTQYIEIDFEQVHFVFVIICIGIFLSFCVLAIENLVFIIEQK